MLKDMLGEVSVLFSYPKHLIMLAVRLILAYGFLKPTLVKLNDLTFTSEWFSNMAIPMPHLSAYVVTGIEVIGIVLLILGLFTRQISILLSFVVLGAIYFVHEPNGFSAANNGIEIPLYYFCFLLIIASFGAGKYSLDNLFFKDNNSE